MPRLASFAPDTRQPGLPRGVQLRQHPGQGLARHMEQGSVGEGPLKVVRWQVKREEILLPESLEIPSRATAKIQYREQ